MDEALREKIDGLPQAPGVYLMKDREGTVVYVGKASNLRSRVRSYFSQRSSDARFFVALLDKVLGDLETIVTRSDKEAMILENNLIKEHRPRYNIKLRDDKDYLCLRIDPTHEWPWVEVRRRPKPDGAWYFGPYHSAQSIRRVLRLANKHFQLRTCSDRQLYGRSRPCIQYQIKRCPAPCVLPVDKDFYAQQVRYVAMFLQGKHAELVHKLDGAMREASAEEHFERAAMYRDQLRAVDKVLEEQRVVRIADVDQDVFGLHREDDAV